MIYRSRYLDRMLFSPLGYRHDARPAHAKRTQRALNQPYREAARTETAQPAARYQDYPQQAEIQSQHQVGLGERASYLSSRELRIIVGRCEETIRGGRAQIEDYEAFVICQQELSSRV